MAANAKYVEDITIPDDTKVLAGTSFTKSWLVKNNGTVDWTPGFRLVYSNGVNMAAVSSIPLPPCPKKEQAQISITMTAPLQPGTHKSNWVFRDDQGNVFGDSIFVQINVQGVSSPAGQKNNFFVDDITIKDDKEVQAGSSFLKTWRIRNTGIAAWNDRYTLNLIGGNLPPEQVSIPVPAIAPGGEVDLSVNLRAPLPAGRYYSDWKMKDDNGQWFGITVWAKVIVPGQPVIGGGESVVAVQAHAPHYSQRDSQWANFQLGLLADSQSIGRWGCMLTCFAMLASAMGHVIDPGRLNTLMTQKGGFASGYLTRWDALQIVFGDIFYDTKLGGGQATIDRINASLDASRPVPVQVDLTPATTYADNDQHWVLVVGRNGTGDFWINDPWELSTAPTSFKARYGRPSGSLSDSILSAIFYHT